jgi:hypothetical protein
MLWLTLVCAASAQALPDSLLFCHGGKVYVLRAGQTKSQLAIADDPGWVYSQPTWLDETHILVMRLKGGKVFHSNVGIATLGATPTKPADIDWTDSWGGAFAIGADRRHGLLGITKLDRRDGGHQTDLYLTLGSADTGLQPARNIATYDLSHLDDDDMVPAEVPRVRFSPDGSQALMAKGKGDSLLYDLAGHKVLHKVLSSTWSDREPDDPEEVSCGGWLSDGRVVVGIRDTGVWFFNPAGKKLARVDTWFPTDGTLLWDLCVGADGRTLYFTAQDEDDEVGESVNIHMVAKDGKQSVLFKDCSSPDVLLPTG